MSHRQRALELLDLFDYCDDEYLENEVEEALALRDEMIPLFVNLLEEIAADPVEYSALSGFAHNYAVPLLAGFGEPATHIPIIKAFSIPYDQQSTIWGEELCEFLPALLCRTAGGDYDLIKTLAMNREVDQFIRGAALEAITLGVARNDLSREEALAFFASLMKDDTLAQPDDFFWSALCVFRRSRPPNPKEVGHLFR